ncbi:MAG TPA: hypothetical protein VK790_07400 [Solirubrobacteraceae bacterium]|jgi:predicted lipoprotein with Yx(FWY)xxD motif|nr:hypothetical protein [Solirubrobacteraceae bacterium]
MRPTLKTLAPVLAVSLSLTLAACGGSSYGSSSTASTNAAAATSSTASSSVPAASSAGSGAGGQSVKTAANSALGATVLVDAQGMTLYHLSSEQNGKFVCTSAACVAAWPPLGAGAGGGSVSGLESVKRPDGTKQLAYKGEPLYTFSGDKAAGEANGQGIKADGGVWTAVTTSGTGASAPAAAGGSGESSSGGSAGGAYGY